MSLSAIEQYLLELINEARLDPLAKAASLGIDLNAGLAPGTLNGSPKQALAHNAILSQAAEGHSDWMLATNTFSHQGDGGSSAGERMAAAGYDFTGSWTWGENLAWYGTTGTVDLHAAADTHDSGLFLSAGHRVNLLADAYREVGLAQVEGQFTHSNGTTYNASMLTEKFARTGTEVFLTGVAYTDTDGDDFYSVGEGEAGLSFTVGGQTSLSAAAGGYQIALPAAAGTVVQITGSGGLDAVVSVDLAGGNVKLDLVDRTWIASSGDMTLVSGVADGRLLGVADLSLTGSDAANRLSGNKGDNLIAGGAGDDLLSGGAGADTLDGGPGRDTAGYVEAAAGVFVRLWSGEGLSGEAAGDVLTGIENLRGSGFADTLVGDGGVNELFGEGGADALWAGDGDDVLSGGAGADVLQGRAGATPPAMPMLRAAFSCASGRGRASPAKRRAMCWWGSRTCAALASRTRLSAMTETMFCPAAGGWMRSGPGMATMCCRAARVQICSRGRTGPTPPVTPRPRAAFSCACGRGRASPAKRRAMCWWASRTCAAPPLPIRLSAMVGTTC
jgi:Ca2+-binding RTX toxin-like protein